MRQSLRRSSQANEIDAAMIPEPTMDGRFQGTMNSDPSHPAANVAPGLLNRQPSTMPVDEQTSVCSQNANWQGTLKIEGSVRVNGQLSGEIEAKDTVFVAEAARVDAKVRANSVIIAGSFQGHVYCSERLEILSTGRLTGEVTTRSLVVHEGAIAEGQVHMTSAAQAAAPGTAPPRTTLSGNAGRSLDGRKGLGM